jgi:hypothetical protein
VSVTPHEQCSIKLSFSLYHDLLADLTILGPTVHSDALSNSSPTDHFTPQPEAVIFFLCGFGFLMHPVLAPFPGPFSFSNTSRVPDNLISHNGSFTSFFLFYYESINYIPNQRSAILLL